MEADPDETGLVIHLQFKIPRGEKPQLGVAVKGVSKFGFGIGEVLVKVDRAQGQKSIQGLVGVMVLEPILGKVMEISRKCAVHRRSFPADVQGPAVETVGLMVIRLGRFANLQYQVNDTCLTAAIRDKFNKIGAKSKETLIPQLLRQPVPGLVKGSGLVGLTTAWKLVGVEGLQAFQNGR